MKKSIILSTLVLALASTSASAFDQERFDRDVGDYHANLDNAKAIVTLLGPFNSDNGIKQAFINRANGNTSKWINTLSRLNSAKKIAEKIGFGSYLSDCWRATTQAVSVWMDGASNWNVSNYNDWDNVNSSKYKQYDKSKAQFQEYFSDCKKQIRTPPDKKDYERELISFGE